MLHQPVSAWRQWLIALVIVSVAGFGASAPAMATRSCPPAAGVAVQVLGSGGPVADDARASTGYLVWVDGRARVVIDLGGGTFQRFGAAGAAFGDLELVALSHFHADHSADLPALLKSGYFSDRRRPLAISGPDGSKPFPSLEGFLEGLLAPGVGAFAYLGGYLDGSDGLVRLGPVEIDHGDGRPSVVLEQNGVRVLALPVPHGIVPSIAYRVEVHGLSIVFGSDQNGSDSTFVEFARDADLLVAHLAIGEQVEGAAAKLHARPSRIGQIAAEADAGGLLLSHFMARSLKNLDASVATIREHYAGPVHLARDMACYEPASVGGAQALEGSSPRS